MTLRRYFLQLSRDLPSDFVSVLSEWVTNKRNNSMYLDWNPQPMTSNAMCLKQKHLLASLTIKTNNTRKTKTKFYRLNGYDYIRINTSP